MFSYEQATGLLGLSKKIIQNDKPVDSFNYHPKFPIFRDRKHLLCEEEKLFFLLQIDQSRKNNLKLTLHLQDDDSSLGLLRVDFNGRHRNPEGITDKVPEIFKPFAGIFIEESHIHYHVEGYGALEWAIPLGMDGSFSKKTFNTANDFESIFRAFSQKINLVTKVNITMQGQLV